LNKTGISFMKYRCTLRKNFANNSSLSLIFHKNFVHLKEEKSITIIHKKNDNLYSKKDLLL